MLPRPVDHPRRLAAGIPTIPARRGAADVEVVAADHDRPRWALLEPRHRLGDQRRLPRAAGSVHRHEHDVGHRLGAGLEERDQPIDGGDRRRQSLEQADPHRCIPDRPAPHHLVSEALVERHDVGPRLLGVRVDQRDAALPRSMLEVSLERRRDAAAAVLRLDPQVVDLGEPPVGGQPRRIELGQHALGQQAIGRRRRFASEIPETSEQGAHGLVLVHVHVGRTGRVAHEAADLRLVGRPVDGRVPVRGHVGVHEEAQVPLLGGADHRITRRLGARSSA